MKTLSLATLITLRANLETADAKTAFDTLMSQRPCLTVDHLLGDIGAIKAQIPDTHAERWLAAYSRLAEAFKAL